jgi:hypothetical protein
MANNSFNLNELYAKVFGYQGSVLYDIPSLPNVKKANAYSILGTPIYEQITVSYSDGKKPDNSSIIKNYTFPDWPLIDISASKNINTTPLKGFSGTVKEYINTDDYQIGIKGILINYVNDEYPDDLVHGVHKIFTVDTALKVTSPVLNLLDIHYMVVKDIKFPEVEGYNNMQPYVLQCLSDNPVELEIKDIKNHKPLKR